jgi:hypothetical protein
MGVRLGLAVEGRGVDQGRLMILLICCMWTLWYRTVMGDAGDGRVAEKNPHIFEKCPVKWSNLY